MQDIAPVIKWTAFMTREISLPDSRRFFEIRFESIGGLGAHVAGQIVASAAVLRMGLNGSHFSSYGSEKKGSVVRSFVRLAPADRAIRNSARYCQVNGHSAIIPE